jgi:hypothetical protein
MEGGNLFLFPVKAIPDNFFQPYLLPKADRDLLEAGLKRGGKLTLVGDFLNLLSKMVLEVDVFPTEVIEQVVAGKWDSIQDHAQTLINGCTQRFVVAICKLGTEQYWLVIDNLESNAYWGCTSHGIHDGSVLQDFIFRYGWMKRDDADAIAQRKVKGNTSKSPEVATTFAMAALVEFFLRDDIGAEDLRQFRDENAESLQQRLMLSVLKGKFIFPVHEVKMGVEEHTVRPVSTMTQLSVRDSSPNRKKKKKKQSTVLQTEGFPRVIVLQNMCPIEEFPNDLSLAIVLLVAFLTSKEQKIIHGVLTPTRLRDYVCRNLYGVSEALFNRTMEGFRINTETWILNPPGEQAIRVQHDPAHTFRVVLTEYGFMQIEHLCKYVDWTFQQGRKSRDALEAKQKTPMMLTAPPIKKKKPDEDDDRPSQIRQANLNHIAIIVSVLQQRLRPLTVTEICQGLDLTEYGWSNEKDFCKHTKSDQKTVSTAIRQAANRGLSDTKKTKKSFYVHEVPVKNSESPMKKSKQITVSKKPATDRYFGLAKIDDSTPFGFYRKQIEQMQTSLIIWKKLDPKPPAVAALFIPISNLYKVIKEENESVTTLFTLHPGTLFELPDPITRSALFRAEPGTSILRYVICDRVYGFLFEAKSPGDRLTVDFKSFS